MPDLTDGQPPRPKGRSLNPKGLELDEIQEKLHAWFQCLNRLARIQEVDQLATAYAPNPLREDIAECVARGWLMAWDDGTKDQLRLMLRPEGWKMYDEFCADLANQGRPVLGWIPDRHGLNKHLVD